MQKSLSSIYLNQSHHFNSRKLRLSPKIACYQLVQVPPKHAHKYKGHVYCHALPYGVIQGSDKNLRSLNYGEVGTTNNTVEWQAAEFIRQVAHIPYLDRPTHKISIISTRLLQNQTATTVLHSLLCSK